MRRPHLRCNNTWRIGPFAAPCYDVPWSERKIVGSLTFPSGKVCALREGDLPNRNPFYPDNMQERRYRNGRRKDKNRTKRKHSLELRGPGTAGTGGLFPDHGKNGTEGLLSLEATDASIEQSTHTHDRDADITPAHGDGEASSSTSHVYDYFRSALLEEYGHHAAEGIARIDKLVNYSGREPPVPEPAKERGMMVPRFTPDGELEAFTPWEDDELDEPIADLGLERLHEKVLCVYVRGHHAHCHQPLFLHLVDACRCEFIYVGARKRPALAVTRVTARTHTALAVRTHTHAHA